jgi:hypothetical protein
VQSLAPMRRLGLLLLAGLAACQPDLSTDGAGGEGGKGDGQREDAPEALGKGDFDRDLDRALLEEVSHELDADALAVKLSEAKDADQLLRSFASAYHADLGQLATDRIPGGESLCFGDAHPANFGLVRIDDQLRFVYNDLDDSGYCPAALDALHYFVALALTTDKDYVDEAIEQYVDTLRDPARREKLSDSLEDEIERRDDDELGDYVRDGELDLGDGSELRDVTAEEWALLAQAAGASERLRDFTLVDAAALYREGGGSGGSRRYWLLVAAPSGKRSIYELKPAFTPGVDFGHQKTTLGWDERLPVLLDAFWHTDEGDFFVDLDGRRYLARDKLGRRATKVDELTTSERHELYRVEVSLMAELHRDALDGIKKDSLRVWLSGSTETMVRRWKDASDDL